MPRAFTSRDRRLSAMTRIRKAVADLMSMGLRRMMEEDTARVESETWRMEHGMRRQTPSKRSRNFADTMHVPPFWDRDQRREDT